MIPSTKAKLHNVATTAMANPQTYPILSTKSQHQTNQFDTSKSSGFCKHNKQYVVSVKLGHGAHLNVRNTRKVIRAEAHRVKDG